MKLRLQAAMFLIYFVPVYRQIFWTAPKPNPSTFCFRATKTRKTTLRKSLESSCRLILLRRRTTNIFDLDKIGQQCPWKKWLTGPRDVSHEQFTRSAGTCQKKKSNWFEFVGLVAGTKVGPINYSVLGGKTFRDFWEMGLWHMDIDNSLHLGRKYAGIFVRRHKLCVPRSEQLSASVSEENFELWGTDNS